MNFQSRISKGTIAKAAENQTDFHEKDKLVKRDWVARVIFLRTNPSDFPRPLRSLFLVYMAENLQVT